MSRYIEFKEISVPSFLGKNIISVINRKGKKKLGEIGFYPAWKKYVFFPVAGSIFDSDCLFDIVLKLNELNEGS